MGVCLLKPFGKVCHLAVLKAVVGVKQILAVGILLAHQINLCVRCDALGDFLGLI